MSDPRSAIPSVGALIEEAAATDLAEQLPRSVLIASIRQVVDAARAAGGQAPVEGWLEAVRSLASRWDRPSLTRVINATGVVLHTNLGRAPLSQRAREAVLAAMDYSTLEYDLEQGDRGSRQVHVRSIITNLVGGEDALVTVNAASALLLAVNTIAAGAGTVISRGELVEIGGSFRLPDIIERSTSKLIEVGTTNRTHLRDYENALGSGAACLLKVHRSNFVQSGFVTEVGIADLVELAGPHDLPVVHDVGSGLVLDLTEFGLTGEPLVQASIAAGAITIFSGDKLLGGPQAGILVGPAEHIRRMAANPLARALRPDKVTLAALEATLLAYADRDTALREIPVLAMLTATDIAVRAAGLSRLIPRSRTKEGFSSVGGGAFPEAELPTTLVAVKPASCNQLVAYLRSCPTPIIARVIDDEVVFDVRTLNESEMIELAAAVNPVLE